MSQDPTQLASGKFVLCARIEAKSTDAANELAGLLTDIKRGLEEREPGCLSYRLCQFENKLMVFEEYASQEALDQHRQSEGVQAFALAMQTRIEKPPAFEFYHEL